MRRREFGGGSWYEGEWENNKPHGTGTLVDRKGNQFEGTFSNGAKLFGQTVFANGDFHSGSYENGRRHGNGTYIFLCGDRFDGEFDQGAFARGKFRWLAGEFYVGEFKNGVPHGHGTKRMRNGDKYTGEWKEGKAEGWGVKVFACGDVHEGFYKDNLRHGYGKYRHLNGDTYEGFYAFGKANGRGRFVCKAYTLEGLFKDDKLNGTGVKVHAKSGAKYVGSLEDNKRNGEGVLRWEGEDSIVLGLFERNEIVDGLKRFPSGNRYDGQWKNSLANGLGVKLYANSDRYRGQFKNDYRHGFGIYDWGETRIRYCGYWSESREEGPGTIISPLEHMFCGHFKAGRKDGHAIAYILKDGAILTKLRQIWSEGVKVKDDILTCTNFHRFDPPPSIHNVDMYIEFFLERPLATFYPLACKQEQQLEGSEDQEPTSPAPLLDIPTRTARSASVVEEEPWTTAHGGGEARTPAW